MKLSCTRTEESRDTGRRGRSIFSNWDRTYPLVVGTDAHGRSQWKGTIYEAAIYDRALTSVEVARLSDPNGRKGTRDEGVGTSAAKRQEEKGRVRDEQRKLVP